ncbi:MAG: homoserine kinase [Oscillospiraceae bacterium]|jgi:homoserine kinase|nr:homoserine kinase [Oscillospiraceae bacterium]
MDRVSLRVPATSANLGPGFDSFGCAFALYNTYTFELSGTELRITGCDKRWRNPRNLAIVAYRLAMKAMGLPMERGICMHIDAQIPVCRGLGSSSAMIIGGVLAANLLHGSPLSNEEVLALCTELEGHPDNLAPAIYGGMTASLMHEGRPVTARFPLSNRLRFIALIPDFTLSTQRARAALPKQVPFADAVFNVSHAALLLRALETADLPMISLALDDRLHQPYRKELVAGYDAAREAALGCGCAAFCLSGAGPTCLCIAGDDSAAQKLAQKLPEVCPQWRVLQLEVDTQGACSVPAHGRQA